MFPAIKEFIIYLKYREIVKSEAMTSIVWTRKNLRYDWLCRIYTVVNLPPQVTMSPDIPKESRLPFVFEEMKPINEYMRKCGLEEMITVSVDPIDNTDYSSYLIVYYFIFNKFNFWKMLFYFVAVPSTFIYFLLSWIF